MEDYKKATKQIVSFNLLRGIDFIVMFILLIFLTRFLDEVDYGIYSLVTVSISIFIGLFSLGIPEFIVRDMSGKDHDKRVKDFQSIWLFFIKYGLILTLIIGAFAYVILPIIGYGDLNETAVYAIGIAGIGLFFQIAQSYLRAQKKITRAKLLESLYNNLWAVPAIIFMAWKAIPVSGIFLVRLAYSAAAVAFLFIIYRSFLKGNPASSRYLRNALVFGFPLASIVLSRWLITGADRYILGIIQGAAAVASYTYIYTLLGMIESIAGSIGITLGPYFYSEHNKQNIKSSDIYLNAIIKYEFMIIVPAITGLFVLSNEIISLISGPKYIGASAIIPFLLLFPALSLMKDIYASKLLVRNKTLKVSSFYMIGVLMNIVLNLLLVPKYGAKGAGAATTATYAVLFLLFYLSARSDFKPDMKFIKIGRIAIAAAIMALSIAFISPQTIYTKIATIFLGMAVYGIGLLVLGVIGKGEIDLLKSVLKRGQG